MSYYANGDLAAYERLLADYKQQHAVWQETVAAIIDAYQEAQNSGIDLDGDPRTPGLPDLPPEPQPPAPPTLTYEARELTEPEMISTVTGPALALPPRIVLTSNEGVVFALTELELDAGYTDTSVPLPE